MYLALVVCGWLSIYGASYDFDQSSIFSFDNRAGKQFVWMLTAFMLAGLVLLIDYKVYDSLVTNFIYIGAMLLLLLTIVGGLVNLPFVPDIKGSRSWIVLGPVSFQPAELAKIATALAVARYLSVHRNVLCGARVGAGGGVGAGAVLPHHLAAGDGVGPRVRRLLAGVLPRGHERRGAAGGGGGRGALRRHRALRRRAGAGRGGRPGDARRPGVHPAGGAGVRGLRAAGAARDARLPRRRGWVRGCWPSWPTCGPP